MNSVSLPTFYPFAFVVPNFFLRDYFRGVILTLSPRRPPASSSSPPFPSPFPLALLFEEVYFKSFTEYTTANPPFPSNFIFLYEFFVVLVVVLARRSVKVSSSELIWISFSVTLLRAHRLSIFRDDVWAVGPRRRRRRRRFLLRPHREFLVVVEVVSSFILVVVVVVVVKVLLLLLSKETTQSFSSFSSFSSSSSSSRSTAAFVRPLFFSRKAAFMFPKGEEGMASSPNVS